MVRYEYKVVPAPTKGVKVKGVKTGEERFAHALMDLMNDMGKKGWEYHRADTLPTNERSGLVGRTTKYQNMLIFRRVHGQSASLDMLEESPKEEVAATPEPASLRATADRGRVASRLAASLSSRSSRGDSSDDPDDEVAAAPAATPSRPSGLLRSSRPKDG